jgi:hypothetical protein
MAGMGGNGRSFLNSQSEVLTAAKTRGSISIRSGRSALFRPITNNT